MTTRPAGYKEAAGLDRFVGLRPFARQVSCGKRGRWRTKRAEMIVITGGLALLCSGCQLGPAVPLGFGPQFDSLFGVLVLLAIVAVIYRVFAPKLRGVAKNDSPRAAEWIVRRRYARGELTRDEYEQIVRTLAR